MRLRILARLGASLFLMFGVVAAVVDDGSPPRSRTGAPAVGSTPAEGLCMDCHDSFSVNLGGSVSLIDPPTYYSAGTTYTLTLQVASNQTASNSGRRWGFQITAVDPVNGSGIGTFANMTGQGTTITTGRNAFSTRQYIEVGTQNHEGEASPVTWQFQWTAPAQETGSIHFYFSGMASDGGGGNENDWVYQGSYVLQDRTTPVVPTSWGRLKARYH